MHVDLAGTTKHETRLGGTRESSNDVLREIKVDKNLLKNLLQSHAARMGGVGPARDILLLMGVE